MKWTTCRTCKRCRGANELLAGLHAKGLRIVAASSGGEKIASALLELVGAEPFLSATTTASDAKRSKPAPDIVLAALRKAGASTDAALLIGDTPYDIEAGRAAGVGVLALRSGGFSDTDLAGAVAVYDDPADLLAHLDNEPIFQSEKNGYKSDMSNTPLTELPKSRAVSDLGAHLGTLSTITLWHDFLCPWCYVGLIQSEKLKAEHGVTFDWRGAELFPPALAFTPPPPKPEEKDPNAPPTHFENFTQNEGITMPPKPPYLPMHNALLAAAFVTETHGADKGEAFIAALYRAYWEKHEHISELDVLTRIAGEQGIDAAPLQKSVKADEFHSHILDFDDAAYAAGHSAHSDIRIRRGGATCGSIVHRPVPCDGAVSGAEEKKQALTNSARNRCIFAPFFAILHESRNGAKRKCCRSWNRARFWAWMHMACGSKSMWRCPPCPVSPWSDCPMPRSTKRGSGFAPRSKTAG